MDAKIVPNVQGALIVLGVKVAMNVPRAQIVRTLKSRADAKIVPNVRTALIAPVACVARTV